jgi:hypothetical protein
MTPPAAFDQVTGVEPLGDGVYGVTIDGGWAIAGIPNGGYLLATLARAGVTAGGAVEGPEHPHVLAATAQYVSPTPPGPATVETEVLRRGRRVSQVRARLVADGRPCVDAVFTLGRLKPEAEPWWTDATPPAATPRDECPRTPPFPASGLHLSLMEQVDQRIDPVFGFRFGAPSGRGEFWAWLALADGREPDPLSLLLAVDAIPPATVGLGSTGWVPTLSLTAYVRGVPAPGPLLVHQRARLVEDELVDEVCDVWDSRGRLVAQATQLAAVRTEGPPVASS